MSTQQTRKENYKGESFTSHGDELLQQLESFASELQGNMLSEDKSFLVSHITQKKFFNKVFVNVVPNCHEHKSYKNEHNGLYAFALVEDGRVDFQYIGISRTIKKRFSDHTKSKKKNSANWAFLMARGDGADGAIDRIPVKQLDMHHMRFTFLHIDNPNLRLMAEVYCANKLKSFWNSFDTH